MSAFDPSGLPTLPKCESDIARWAADLQNYLVNKFTVAHNEIDGIIISPVDICTLVGDLNGPSCLIPATGVDTSSFVFAPNAGAPTPPGTLPWPGSVLAELGNRWVCYWHDLTMVAANNWTEYRVNFPVPYQTAFYFVCIENRTTNKCFLSVKDKTTTGFTIMAASAEAGPADLYLVWYTVNFSPNP